MKIATPREVFLGGARIAMTPESALQLRKLGHDCLVETGIENPLFCKDNTRMFYGDARESVSRLVTAVSGS